MNNQPIDTSDIDELLDAAIDEIRHEVVPAFPTTKRVTQLRSSVPADMAGKRHFSAIGISILATTAAVFALVAFFFFSTSRTAFADVQEALLKVKTLRFTVLDLHDDWNSLGPKTFKSHATIVEPHWTRSESDHGGIQISDSENGKRLTIDHKTRTATFYETQASVESKARQLEFLDLFRNIPTHATARIGDTNFNGIPAEQFAVKLGYREFLVTVDSKTKLPVRMEFKSEGFQEIFTDFVFDEEIDMNLFSMESPDGYKVVMYQLADPPKFASSIVVSSKSGIDDFNFGSTVDEVIKHLGKPSDRNDDAITGIDGKVHKSTRLRYHSLGLYMFFNSHGLSSMRCQSQARNGSTVHDFAGKTDKGLRIGDSRDTLIELYGVPDYEDKEKVDYVRQGISFYLDGENVSGINISPPLDPRLNFEVDPNTGARKIWIGDNANPTEAIDGKD